MEARTVTRMAGIMGWVLLLATWVAVLIGYTSLPARIPIHFNARGAADNYGPRASIWLLLALLTGVFLLLSALGRHAHRLPRTATEPPPDMARLRLFFAWLRLSVLLVFVIDIAQLFPAVLGAAERERNWLLPLNLLLVFLPTGWFLWTVLRGRARQEG
ncbi:MAG: DUF1648 domain-containing protein [Chitinophagaceae bacterium]|nr:MAG: DUF1648 domain-containing protein [Chitinophagaceae bacterium]